MSSGNVHGGSAAQLFGVARVDILLCGLDAVSEMIHRSMLPASIPQSSLTLLWSQTGYLPARRARRHNPPPGRGGGTRNVAVEMYAQALFAVGIRFAEAELRAIREETTLEGLERHR